MLDMDSENVMSRRSTPPIVWTIAGHDPSSGAGVTADLMTFAAHGLFGCSAITALTAQSTLGVKAVEEVGPGLLTQTLVALQDDLPPQGVKIGMLSSPEILRVVAGALRELGRSTALSMLGVSGARLPFVVLDPVLRSSSGRDLYPAKGVEALREELLPLVDVVTPNWSELAVLTGRLVESEQEAEEGARELISRVPNLSVVVTGGDQKAPVDTLVSRGSPTLLFAGEHIVSEATHGTGCAFSSALLANLVLGASLSDAVRSAKLFVAEAILQAPGLGRGKGPLGLLWPRALPR